MKRTFAHIVVSALVILSPAAASPAGVAGGVSAGLPFYCAVFRFLPGCLAR